MNLRKIIPGFLKKILQSIYVRQFKLGLTPQYLTLLSETELFSKNNSKWDFEFNKGFGGWLEVPNTSGGYHGILVQWWEKYDLGQNCLLISETKNVKKVFAEKYPGTEFIATDYYVELLNDASTDVLWNLYEVIPEELERTRFDSIICQATFEHLMDPIDILKKFTKLSKGTSHIFLHTHTPYYPKHNWPSDYLRYFPEWFKDVPVLIKELNLVELYSEKGHIFALYKVSK
jgi:hypothetical protein